MNATKPNSVADSSSGEAAAAGVPAGRSRSDASKRAARKQPKRVEAEEVDFERHDTIPAPTWLDDGSESS
ncbi:MAG: hypothetical protein QM756_21155 [Polyangiaceae bacterium]